VVELTLHAGSTAPCNKGVTRKLFYTKASGRLTHFMSLYIVQPNGIVSLLDCTHKNRMLFLTVCHELCTRFVLGEHTFILLKLRKMFGDELENRDLCRFHICRNIVGLIKSTMR
jgi:hypothetical protein